MGTWGVELWDQRDNLEKYTQNAIDFFEKCASFVKERVAIEQTYAKSLRKLVKSYQFKKKEEDDLPYSYQHAFKNFLQENDDFAGQREVISEEMHNTIFKEMHKLAVESKVDRKKTFKKMSDHKSNLDHQHNALLASKRKYHNASEDAANALKAYEQAAQSLDLTKAQIMKFQKTSEEKGNIAKKGTDEYKAALENFNSKQTLHYEGEMPNIINTELQTTEENLIHKLSSFLNEFSQIQLKVAPIISKCFEGMVDAAKLCDASKDSLTFIERCKSGELHPGDLMFEEYGKPPPTAATLAANKTKTVKPSIFGATKKKDAITNDGMANDYADLPPAQRKIKFNKAISSLQDQLNQLEKAKDGMLKIKETSEKFGGDLATIQGQIEENEREVERIKPILNQYQCYLAAAIDSEANRSRPSSTISPPPAAGIAEEGGNDEDLPPPPPPPPPPADEFQDEFDDEHVLCSVLYDFSGNNEGELTVYAGESLTLVDEDGSGWSRVARGSDEGYIPSSYITKI